jgi:hypothetical protein
LYHIIEIPLLDLFYAIACFWPANHHVESELSENFQDIDFKDLEQQQEGFKGKCP